MLGFWERNNEGSLKWDYVRAGLGAHIGSGITFGKESLKYIELAIAMTHKLQGNTAE